MSNETEIISQEMENNPYRLEELREEDSEYDYPDMPTFRNLKKRVEIYMPDTDLANKIKKLEEKRKLLITRNEEILSSQNPNMPTYRNPPNSNNYVVYREEVSGKIKIGQPI